MPQTDSSPRAGQSAGAETNLIDNHSVRQASTNPRPLPRDRLRDASHQRETIERLVSVEAQIEQAGRRILQDVFTEGLAAYWERRAQTFEDARAKPGDYQPPHLQVTEEERAQRDRDLAETALACRRRAEFIRAHGDQEAVYMVAVGVCDPLSAQNRESGEVAA